MSVVLVKLISYVFIRIGINSFSEGRLSKSMDRTPTAVFQFVARNTNKFLIQASEIARESIEIYFQILI